MKNEMMRYVCLTIVILMAVGSTSALTTFYNSKNSDSQQNKTQPPPIVRGRECKADSDCNGITNTVCMRDHRDRKMRCLCVNKSAPVNGACPRYPKALKSSCNDHKECIEGAHCSTQTNSSSTAKSCMCKEGFYEDDHLCNGGFLSSAPSYMTLLIAFSILCLVGKSDSTF